MTAAASAGGLWSRLRGFARSTVVLSGEEMARGDFKAMLGMSDRGATDALGALVKRGLLKSDSPQGKVRFGLPQHALRFLFPQLWPEAEADVANR